MEQYIIFSMFRFVLEHEGGRTMYAEKMLPILENLENKDLEIAGGSVVGIVLGTVNSLIKYIANMTFEKKKYEDVQEKVKDIFKRANELKIESLEVIDKDKEVLEKILNAYKSRKEDEKVYQEVCKKATEFCMQVLYIARDTLLLSDEISKVGNRMLVSDFKICKHYSVASVNSAIEDVYINLEAIEDVEYKNKILAECKQIKEETRRYL